MPRFDQIRLIWADWMAFAANPVAWRRNRKLLVIRLERELLRDQYVEACDQHRRRQDLRMRLNHLTLLELQLINGR